MAQRVKKKAGGGKTGRGAPSAGGIQERGWPSRRLKRWPIPPEWAPEPPPKRVGPVGYQKVVGTVRALFADPAMATVLEGLQDFCFQQGAHSNANARDRTLFFDILTHDLVFFAGDKDRPIVDDLPIDPKIYDALPQMRGSLMDIYRVERRGIAGGLRLHSVLRDKPIKAGTRLFRGPRVGDHVLGRVVQIGRGFFLDEPLLSVQEEWIEALVATFEEELAATRQSHSNLSRASLLKVAGYHLYESVAAHALRRDLSVALGERAELAPVIVRHRLRSPRDLPDLAGLPGCTVRETNDAGRATIVTVRLLPAGGMRGSVGELMITAEDKEVIAVAFVSKGAAEVFEALAEMMPSSVVTDREVLTPTGLYRSLRHTLKAR